MCFFPHTKSSRSVAMRTHDGNKNWAKSHWIPLKWNAWTATTHGRWWKFGFDDSYKTITNARRNNQSHVKTVVSASICVCVFMCVRTKHIIAVSLVFLCAVRRNKLEVYFFSLSLSASDCRLLFVKRLLLCCWWTDTLPIWNWNSLSNTCCSS